MASTQLIPYDRSVLAHRSRTLRTAALALVLAGSLSAVSASAQEPPFSAAERERATALTLGREGLTRYNEGDFAGAAEKLAIAYRLAPVPTLGLWLGRALVQLNRLVEAEGYFAEVEAMKMADVAERLSQLQSDRLSPEGLALHQAALEEAKTDRQALRARIPKIKIVVTGAEGVEIIVDDQVRSDALSSNVPLDPGVHRVIVKDGAREQKREVSLGEGQTVTVEIVFEAPTAPPPPVAEPVVTDEPSQAQAIVGYTALGLGGAALIAGGVMSIVTLSRYGALDCPDDRCGNAMHEDADSYNALRIPSGVLLIAGGVVAAGGLVLVLTAPDEQEARGQEVGLRLGLGSLSLWGRF